MNRANFTILYCSVCCSSTHHVVKNQSCEKCGTVKKMGTHIERTHVTKHYPRMGEFGLVGGGSW